MELPRPVASGLRVDVPVGVMVRRLPPLPTETNGFAEEVVVIDEVVEAKAVVEVNSVAPKTTISSAHMKGTNGYLLVVDATVADDADVSAVDSEVVEEVSCRATIEACADGAIKAAKRRRKRCERCIWGITRKN